MNIDPLILSPFKFYKPTFGILSKPPIKKVYAPNCWNEVLEGEYKDCTFTIYNNHQFGMKGSTVIIYRKAGEWIKSKLKYIMDGKRKVLWSYAKNAKND